MSESPFSIGRRLGVYDITGRLGEGGMGQVFRARDTKLGRDVAMKVLPPGFMADPDRLARFEREARVLASLNHPHIAAIYGIETSDEVKALILELVDGETLADRLKRGSIPLKDALAIARQIADALDAAHERGIVHRDLKPANIAITHDGVVKVLDFGLAKMAQEDGSQAAVSPETPTIGHTAEGSWFGTPAYMSPEQARGKAVDKRTDIWSFGCVLHEMLTGRRPFAGETASDLIAAVLDREPDWTLLAATPAAIQRLLRRCLQKDPKQRLRDAADVRLEIEDALSAIQPAQALSNKPATQPAAWRWGRVAAVAAGLVIAGVLGAVLAGLWRQRQSAAAQPAAAMGTLRLVVLPFENLSRQPDDEWLAGAFSDSLTLGLRDAENIVLVNREHLLEMDQSRNTDPAKIARALGVQYYVNGSYQRVGDSLKVVARLVEAGAGTIKLQESFTDRFANLLNIEDDLARRFSTALEGSAAAPKRISTASLDAYRAVAEANDLYLAGRFREAVQRLESAAPQDERYADAWALLGKSYAQLSSPNNLERGARSDLLDRALKASQRAIDLSPSLYEAQVALATTYQQLGQVESWRIAAEKAIDLNPRLAEGYVLLGDSYGPSPAFGCARKRDSDLAERSYRKALQLNPHFGAAHARLITNFFWSGREDQALRAADEALRLLPDNVNVLRARAAALVWLRRADDVEQQVNQLGAIVSSSVLEEWALAVVDLLRGKKEEAEVRFKHAIESGPVAHREIDTGRIYAAVGQTPQAAAHLQHAFALDSACAGFVAQSPAFAPYLKDPALRALLSRYQPAR